MGNASTTQFGTVERRGIRDTRSSLEPQTDGQHGHAPELIVESVIPPDPAVSARAALAGYVGTGHSPSGAT